MPTSSPVLNPPTPSQYIFFIIHFLDAFPWCYFNEQTGRWKRAEQGHPRIMTDAPEPKWERVCSRLIVIRNVARSPKHPTRGGSRSASAQALPRFTPARPRACLEISRPRGATVASCAAAAGSGSHGHLLMGWPRVGWSSCAADTHRLPATNQVVAPINGLRYKVSCSNNRSLHAIAPCHHDSGRLSHGSPSHVLTRALSDTHP